MIIKVGTQTTITMALILLTSCAPRTRIANSKTDTYPKICDQGPPEGGGADYRTWEEEQRRNNCNTVGLYSADSKKNRFR